MPEQVEEGDKSNPKDQHGGEKAGEPLMTMFMDFDLDLDASSWPLGHQMLLPPITFSSSSNPMSPIGLFPSNSDQLPCSPLWALSDSEGLDTTATPTNRFPPPAFAGPGGLSFSDYPLSSTCNPSSVGGNPMENDDKKKVLSPLVGLMPVENPDGYCTFKERMTQALRYFIESTEQRVLAQVWAPIRKGGRCMLTTLGQPFVLDPQSTGLNQYRMVSVMYTFSVDGETDGQLGLPGRVFRQKLPEWSPNVQYYSSQEYSRLDHAFHHNVRGTLALPVFESSGQSCVGVLELILTSQKINYAPEVDKVCKALEAVNLKSSDILEHPKTQICDEARQNALAEILEILTVLCETYKLPLAQTWVPCMQRSVLAQGSDLKKSCTSFDGSCNGQVCMSTLDVSFYVVDAHKWGFREACLEHHLQNGQGVAGRAFYSHNSCFCRDITQFCKTQYPLVHYARLFGLTGSFAICLRSSHTGDDDYVLEFFLPPNITDFFEQKTLMGFLLTTMKQRLHSLKVASGVDLEEEGFVEIIQASTSGTLDIGLECVQIPQSTKSSPEAHVTFNGGQFESLKNQPLVDVDAMDNGCNIVHANGSHATASLSNNKEKKPHKKRGKTEKSISLEVLQQYFAGSLKDAAKSLGVCPTTMKRICRQHGISRWPSRKINKVNRSLNKLKRVMESVQGTDGALCLNPLSTSPVPVAVSSISWPSNIHGCNQQNSPASRPAGPHDDHSGSTTCRTPRSTVQAGDEDHSLGCRKSSQEHPLMQNGSTPDFGEGSSKSRTGSGSQEESAGSPTCHGSCQSSPANDSTPAKNTCVSPCHEQCSKGGGLPEQAQPTEELNLLAACTMPDALTAPDVQEPFGRMLVEDAGSSKDLRNLCPSVADAILDEQFLEPSWTNPPCQDLPPTQAVSPSIDAIQIVTGGQEMKSITIKATYREDIIRFRFSPSSGIVELKEQVGKRLKLEVGTFDIRYLDDDHEWVLIACNADLQECIDVSRSSGSNIVRLAVHDLNANLGSSCESTGEL